MSTSFEPPDFYHLDELLTDEERITRQTVRDFVEKRVIPIIGGCYEEGRFPSELVPELAALGLFGANLQGYGCAGIGDVAYGLALQELERGDSGVRSFVSVQGSLTMHAIHAYGSEEHRRRWLPAMARGEAIGCFGLTEPDFGSDPAGLKTRAERHGDEYVLNGNKRWITNGSVADVAVVWAKEEGRIQGFLVEKDRPGFSTTLQKGKWSMRASVTSELHFQDCRIPAANRLPEARGLGAPLGCLNQARAGIAWGAVGAAMACYSEALEYAKSRIQFGRPIASFQLVQQKLVDMLAGITQAQLLAHRLGRLKEAGKVRPQQVSLAKRQNVAMALDVARTARDILAANGITYEYQCGRHLANLETVKTYEGTHDIHTLILGEDITGIGAFGGDDRT
ncbi:MAG: acyl-CoA dehydrogenase family protein [Planctomycetota bacterium]|nr:acyl-CoA dehydrogenase family protein [Planctomycetota bacterium]